MNANRNQTTWWLDSGALPSRLLWARLDVAPDGAAVVFDLDGKYHRFSDLQTAKLWLLEDEYSSLAFLVEEGEVSADLAPPAAASDQELLKLMVVDLTRAGS